MKFICCPGNSSGEDGEPLPQEPKKGRTLVPDVPPRRVVAFTAKLNTAHSTPYHSGVLKLVDVLVNEGEAYSPDTGIFTCPLEGFYHFTVHMSVNGRAQCAIFKNGESLASVYHTSLPDKCSQVASVSSTVQLSEGDMVWVNLWGHGRHEIIATDDNDTVFVGFYLG
ncbi:complement C1q tumor necrosis factor-related protein 5-like [Sparus aurata]|uniref:complement C1q tumor necrosis factor-related protein 5-like n=1 Tax=Sparus aurata TaxID=8175 RepID=UPI0011C1C9A2|nr:complement C1q tumor necrosis factor-related protein 5-like [Sparus aurata]XP_030298612.1 complement C1q tumor necrosis factor-related protein 5-like [Sparus aurata]